MRQALACLHDWGPWEVVSTEIVARMCNKCGATQEARR
jgi:hypothetical protein